MTTKPDITINLPSEHYDALVEVLAKGLKYAKIDDQTRKELTSWWEAEREFIREELDQK